MKATYIDYKDTNSFSKLLLAYLDRHPQLDPFLNNWPDMAGFRRQIDQKHGKTDRAALVDSLRDQYGGLLADHAKVASSIDSLLSENTFTITTGHQLNIFTGPLYFIFKIVSTIKLSQDLKAAYPEYNFVPVYWMATEDHDFAEINHTKLSGKKLSWDAPALSATGRMDTHSMTDVVRNYQNFLGLSENSENLARLVEEAYLGQKNLADATRYLVNALFAEYGLVIVDADKKALKDIFAPIIKDDIFHEKSAKAIDETSQQLADLGYKTQVNTREINFFYLTNEYRERIVKTPEGKYEVLHRNLYFTQAGLEQEINDHPERFSPNVVMRPVYQELILPNLAYIGGGAEMVYWFQLKAAFDTLKVDFPILVPRNSAMIIDDSLVMKIFRMDLTFKSVFKKSTELKNEYVRRHTKHRLNLKDEWMEFNAIFGKIKLRAHKIDPSLGPSSEAIKARLKKAINNLERKLLKADKRNHEEALIQIERIKEKLFPGGVLQERVENFGLIYVKYGDELIADLLQHFKPLDFKFTVVY